MSDLSVAFQSPEPAKNPRVIEEEKQPTPKWMKRLVRRRMEETGEKYTQALRAVKAEHEKRQGG